MTPIVIVTMVTSTLATVAYSDVWVAKTRWTYVMCLFEQTAVALTLPVLWNLTVVCWLGHEAGSAKTIFFLVPAYSVLYVYGSTYISWFLATIGLATGIWMMKKQLDLDEIER